MKHRPTEVKAIVELLSREWADEEELARTILDTLMEIKWSRDTWIILQREDGSPYFTAWGPYVTKGEAERDLGKRILGISKTDSAYFAKVYNRDVSGEPHPDLLF